MSSLYNKDFNIFIYTDKHKIDIKIEISGTATIKGKDRFLSELHILKKLISNNFNIFNEIALKKILKD